MPAIHIHGAHAAYRHPGDPSAAVAFIDSRAVRVCGLLRNSAWPAKGQQPVAVMEHAVLRFLSTLSERLLRQELVALLDCVETALRPLAGPSKDFPMEGRWDLGGSLALIAPFDRQVSIARVGDFRVVRLRDGHLDVLAREHTLRAQLDSEGQAMPPHADFGNVIVAYLGGSLPIPDDAISTFDVEAGDRIAIFENPGSRAVNEDLPILSSVCNLTPEESAKRVLDASLARSTGQVVGRAVGIIDVVE